MKENLQLALDPRTLHTLLPHVIKAAAEEWESETVKVELENLAIEIASRLQRVARGE